MRNAYTIYIIPDEHAAAARVALALINGDDPAWSNSFSVPANDSGSASDPATHWFGGAYSTEEWESLVSNMATNPPVASWPVTGLAGAQMSEADVIAAAAAMQTNTGTTQDGTLPDPLVVKNAGLAAWGLKEAVWSDDT